MKKCRKKYKRKSPEHTFRYKMWEKNIRIKTIQAMNWDQPNIPELGI